jgi:signal transduction histidine kinase
VTSAVRYSISVASTAIAIALTIAMPDFLAPMRFFFLWSAALFIAVIAGTGPALLGVALSIIAATFLVFEPAGSSSFHSSADVLRLAMFTAFATALSIAVGSRQRVVTEAATLNTQLRDEVQERRRHEDNAAFINRASELLATSLSHAATMTNLTKLCVPAIGDWCAVHIGSDENYERLAVEHADPSKIRLLEELGRAARPAPENDAIYSVLTTRQPRLVEDFSEEMLAALAATNAQSDLLRRLGFRSWIIAPMLARGRVRRAAVAIDNARRYEDAEAANRAKDEFLATLSHELRTPLTAISGWAHMLELGMTDEATTKLAVATITRSAKAQAELIDDLLDLSRVVAGTLHLNVVDVDLARLVGEVVLAAKPAADAKSIQLELSVPSQPVMVRGDDRRLRQIVWNLLTNAVKFTDFEGHVHVTLAIAAPSSARIEVTDTGRGIDAAFLPYVWERFRQADSSTSREYGGLGLGLAVVRHLAEMHGGTVHAESPGAGRGATFTVEVPLARVLTQSTSDTRPSAALRLTGKRILVVDDDDDARTVLAAMLRQGGADATAVGSAAEALAQIERTPFDLIVSDIAMPGEDGYSLVRRLRETRAIPVIAVSAMGTGPNDRRRALDAGFIEFVRKPVDPDELVETVARLS